MPSFDSKFSLCNYAARVNFPAIYFLHFVARNARTPNLFCVNILKDKPSQLEKALSYVRAEAGISIYWFFS